MTVDGSPFRLEFDVAEYLDSASCSLPDITLLCDERLSKRDQGRMEGGQEKGVGRPGSTYIR